MMKHIYLALLLSFLFLYSSAQQVKQTVISPAGGFSNSRQYSLEWTLGEIVAATHASFNQVFTQGFNQPYIIIESKDGNLNEMLTVVAMPNPTTDIVNVTFKKLQHTTYTIAVTGMTGAKVLHKEKYSNPVSIKISLASLAAGTYLLSVYDADNALLHSTKLIKL